ncbi:asparaginase [Nonomuraea cavernae]|uniref:Asparaginase n=1 Tax=Nonomuraea cavernae TaxID=2045107 RepID=A0A917YX05_9ACTN|nr:asparaginase [Nonomuraea cavernae]MCA2187334.1 asparaginase [Nonomuraea cavernae]GGO68298.1 asparaginase [Nonomuraea cavernae]
MSLVVEVVRSGFVESRHQARMLTFDADGRPGETHGAVHVPASPRSSMKPLQALGMLRAGLRLDGELLALACGSHAGEPYHVNGARKILAGAGLDESALRCPEDYPEDRAVTERSRVRMNCSGKHAAMLATCVVNDWPVTGYLDPAHPLQRAIRATVEELTGERVAASGVDGCGAPLFFVSMVGVARAFRTFPLAADDSFERRIYHAMTAHPEWTSGTGRMEATLMRAVPGLMLKAGAEAFEAFALADGRVGVVKVEDGSSRARTPLTVAALRALGVDVDLPATPVMGGGRPVGELRVTAS